MQHKIVNQHGQDIPKRYRGDVKSFLYNGKDSAIIHGHKVTVIEDFRKSTDRTTKVNVEWIDEDTLV